MEHLTDEILAGMVERPPTEAERAHLDTCDSCGAALAELRTLTENLGALPALIPPRGDWRELEARLNSEGLIQSGGARRWYALSMTSGWIRAAAVAAIFAAGAMTGSAFAEQGGQDVALSGDVAGDPSDLGSAESAVQAAEQRYAESLLAYRRILAENGELPGDDPARRAQALELLVQAGQNAVRAAPDDPYINSFLLNVLTERSASVRNANSGGNWF